MAVTESGVGCWKRGGHRGLAVIGSCSFARRQPAAHPIWNWQHPCRLFFSLLCFFFSLFKKMLAWEPDLHLLRWLFMGQLSILTLRCTTPYWRLLFYDVWSDITAYITLPLQPRLLYWSLLFDLARPWRDIGNCRSPNVLAAREAAKKIGETHLSSYLFSRRYCCCIRLLVVDLPVSPL